MSKKMKNILESSKSNTIIGIHNYPGSSLPSHSDLILYEYWLKDFSENINKLNRKLHN